LEHAREEVMVAEAEGCIWEYVVEATLVKATLVAAKEVWRGGGVVVVLVVEAGMVVEAWEEAARAAAMRAAEVQMKVETAVVALVVEVREAGMVGAWEEATREVAAPAVEVRVEVETAAVALVVEVRKRREAGKAQAEMAQEAVVATAPGTVVEEWEEAAREEAARAVEVETAAVVLVVEVRGEGMVLDAWEAAADVVVQAAEVLVEVLVEMAAAAAAAAATASAWPAI